MPLIGYARVSTEDQTPLPQSQALKSAGCVEIHEEQASGGNRARPVLARVLERISKGDTLVVVRIDRLARMDGYMERLNETAQDWVPHVRRLRPDMAWEDVLRIVNGPLPRERQWTQSRLLRAVNAYVRDGFLPQTVLARAGRRETDDRLPAIVAGIKGADPKITLQEICAMLEKMRERTPRGRTNWQPSSVKMLLERAERLGLLQ